MFEQRSVRGYGWKPNLPDRRDKLLGADPQQAGERIHAADLAEETKAIYGELREINRQLDGRATT